ncbi:MAG: 50S ribosomal protein L17 [Patescibacteria group bacterium]|jgi:large subunit ribosomal protein L17
MRQLGMKKAHREHVIRNAAASLLLYEQIDTTAPRAKEVKAFVEKIIVKAKLDDLHAKRQIYSILFDKNAADKVLTDLKQRYSERKSGFIKSYRLHKRLGDNAQVVRLMLVDKKVFVKEPEKATDDKKDSQKKLAKKTSEKEITKK